MRMQIEYSKQALRWLQQSAHQVDQVECQYLLDLFEAKDKHRSSSGMRWTRSAAMLSVMKSGISIAEAGASTTGTPSLMTMKQLW
jgi:hypothetical protein